MMYIKLENIKKTIGRRAILRDVSLNIYENVNIGIIGHNGSGKTTLLKIITGVTKPNSGKIILDEQFGASFHLNIGVQFQSGTYPVGLNVSDVLNFVHKTYNVDVQSQENLKLRSFFQIDEMRKYRADTLSGGELKRLNIYLALCGSPKIAFLDELTNEIDISKKSYYIKFIRDWCKHNNITIVLISHNLDEIVALCKYIYVLKDGVLTTAYSSSKFKKMSHDTILELLKKMM